METPPLTDTTSRFGAASRVLLAAFCAAGALTIPSSAQQLMVGGPDTFIRRTLPVIEDFSVVGACGGIVESMVGVGELTFIGDVSGVIYLHEPGVGVNYAFPASNDAVALAATGSDLFVGGSDGSIEVYSLSSYSLLETLAGPVGLRALTVYSGQLLAAGDSGEIFTKSAFSSEPFTLLGSTGMPVTAIVGEGSHLVLGGPGGVVRRFSYTTLAVSETFTVGSDVAALGVSLDQVLVAGSEGIVRRIDPEDGTVLDAMSVGSSVRGLALTAGDKPAFSYCYGVTCPCGNSDAEAGCANSRGRGARIATAGTASVLADDLKLFITGAPANTTTIVFMGNGLASGASLGDGLLCIGSGSGLQRFSAKQTGVFGSLVIEDIRQTAMSEFGPAFQVAAGSTWSFQAWYRDVNGPCGSASNSSNSALVVFEP